MNKTKIFSLVTATMCLVLSVAISVKVSAAPAGETAPSSIAEEMVNSSGISWLMNVDYRKLHLTLVRPDGTFIRKTFTGDDAPYLNLSEIFGESACDGHYNYELRVIATEGEQGSRFTAPRMGNKVRSVKSGTFEVKDSVIVTQGDPGELSRVQSTDHPGDVVITGDLCVGPGCSSGMNFGSMDGIRLEGYYPRITFDDQNAGTTLYNAWNIFVEDDGEGGGYLTIEEHARTDATHAVAWDKILTLTAGAGNYALYLDSNGHLGMGTNTPTEELHIKADDTTGIILEQTSSGGQTWRLAGNTTNFFIADSATGTSYPFKIEPGAPDKTLVLKSTGKVGMGTDSPYYNLEVEKTNQNCSIGIERTDGATGKLVAGLYGFQVGSVSNHALKLIANDTVQMTIYPDGTLTMSDGGSYDGSWNPASSREIKDDITNLGTSEALKALEELTPVKYVYKRNKSEKRVGFIAEDVPELVATNSRKNLSTMDIVAVLTKVVKEQQKTIAELKEKVAQLDKRDNK